MPTQHERGGPKSSPSWDALAEFLLRYPLSPIVFIAVGLGLMLALSYGLAMLGEPQSVWLWHIFGVR